MLKFINDFEKEYWFIENKYSAAKRDIGKTRFAYIVNKNIHDGYDDNEKVLYKNVKKYLNDNKEKITVLIKKKQKELKKRWLKFEKDFFYKTEQITKTKWKHKNYNVYFLYSCFWGGDYDIEKPNIYINPLLEHGDPLYIIFHELSHLMYWEHINQKYSKQFVNKNYKLLWNLSEIMVNYPLIKIGFNFPLIVPKKLEKFSKGIINDFKKSDFIDIITKTLKEKAEF